MNAYSSYPPVQTALASAAVAAIGAPNAAHAQTYAAYAMAYFKESPNLTDDSYALHLAVSSDGLDWTPLNQNNPVATPTAGMEGLRDPFLLRKQDGTFVALATDLKGRVFHLNNQYIHVWDSTDLRSFTGYRRVKLHDLATHSWAPTAFWDASRGRYAVVYSANNGTRDILMVNYTSDFVNMGAAEAFFDPGFSVLDGDVLIHNGTFYLAYKNLADNNLYVARSTTGQPNTFTTLTSGLRQGDAIEAPILVTSNSANTFWLWGDSFGPANAVFYPAPRQGRKAQPCVLRMRVGRWGRRPSRPGRVGCAAPSTAARSLPMRWRPAGGRSTRRSLCGRPALLGERRRRADRGPSCAATPRQGRRCRTCRDRVPGARTRRRW
ncbi:glycoside hydrolase family 43 protein [Glycomyces luteolus]|uniref:glycoside hydrolase family 43 protein n=1 Tax=Glycomyces luteolus TaxID=2670330 RepID=UPI0038CC0F51